MKIRYFAQRQSNLMTIRLRVPVGIIYPEQLEVLKQVVSKYGTERVHLTVRKTVEIPGISMDQLDLVLQELAAAGWDTAAYGNNIRNVVACPGSYSCSNSRIDTQSLGLEIDSNMLSDEDLPAKLKIAIAGCPNSCTHPQVNDIGIIGVSKVSLAVGECDACFNCIDFCREKAIERTADNKAIVINQACIDCGLCADLCQPITVSSTCYRVMVGGKVGRHPQFGLVLGDFPDYYAVLDKIEQIIMIYKKYAEPEERLGAMISRLSFERFARMV
jgi:dissimilatory sulfite reductase (desulfoviridin) alpha/beta subunit